MFKKAVSICLAALMLVSVVAAAPAVYATNDLDAGISSSTAVSSADSLLRFLAANENVARPNDQIAVPLSSSEVTLNSGESLSASFNVANEGLYALKLTYKCLPGLGTDPVIKIKVNGEYPYAEASSVKLKRTWVDVNVGKENIYGDEIVPNNEEIFKYSTVYISDIAGFYGGTLYFYLKSGENTISIDMDNEDIVISALAFAQEKETPAYKDVAETYTADKYEGDYIKVEAESTTHKSDTIIYRFNDATSPAITPYSLTTKRLNATGGTNWKSTGMYLEWTVDVPTNGLYELTFKAKQNTNVGVSSYRNITIDGEYPFEECKNYEFKYSRNFENITLCDADGNPMLFELSEGSHTIRMTVSLGKYADILSYISDSADILGEAYRQIIMITTADPETYRDYEIPENLPEVMEIFEEQEKVLYDLRDQLQIMFNSSSTGTKVLETLAIQLESFNKDYFKITEGLSTFKTNITSLTNWLQNAISQPLVLDYFILSAPEKEIPSASAGFWPTLKHSVLSFINTFTDEYLNFTADEDSVTVWASAGQVSMNAIQELVEDEFIEETGIKINLKYVTASTLMALVAGKGPDIALTAPEVDVMNWAFRDAVVPLNDFEGFDEVMSRFRQSAIDQVLFEEKVYAVPRTQLWNMMYVRDDILKEQNIEVPNTWKEVISVMSALKKKNLEFGIPTTMFNTFLYQHGGSMYNKELTTTKLNSLESISAFSFYSSLFTDYSVPKSFNAENRLRTGEMPIVIAPYTLCNTLSLSAPEIQGKWSMHLLPAMEKEDGTINRSVCAETAYSCIVSTSKDPEHLNKCWEFLKWWSSDDVQYKYSQKMEQVLGVSARVAVANIETMSRIAWDPDDLKMLTKQAETLVGVPAVPGNYYMTRHLTNALNQVFYSAGVPAEEIVTYSLIIDNEINRKREELGFSTAKGGK